MEDSWCTLKMYSFGAIKTPKYLILPFKYEDETRYFISEIEYEVRRYFGRWFNETGYPKI